MLHAAFALLAVAIPAFPQPAPVILISVYTLRADRASAFAPFAEHDTTFTAADSQAPLALPSRTALAQIVAANQPKSSATPAPALTPQQRALLSSNGYLSPGPKSTSPTLADPKDRLLIFNQYEDAQIAPYKGRLAEAAAILRKILVTDPSQHPCPSRPGRHLSRTQALRSRPNRARKSRGRSAG